MVTTAIIANIIALLFCVTGLFLTKKERTKLYYWILISLNCLMLGYNICRAMYGITGV
jgi:hypothetical protein